MIKFTNNETPSLPGKLFLAQRGRCFYCPSPLLKRPEASGEIVASRRLTTRPYTVDHVVPQYRNGGGLRNRVLACGPCNHKKGNRMPTGDELDRCNDLYRIMDRIERALDRGMAVLSLLDDLKMDEIIEDAWGVPV